MDDFVILDIAYSNNNNNVVSYMTTTSDVDFVVWHARLGHIGQDKINRLGREDLLGQIAKINLPTCEYYLVGKFIRKPFGKATQASIPLQLIHFDIYCPMVVRARHWYEPRQEYDETRIQERTQDHLETSLYGNLDPLLIKKQEPWYKERCYNQLGNYWLISQDECHENPISSKSSQRTKENF